MQGSLGESGAYHERAQLAAAGALPYSMSVPARHRLLAWALGALLLPTGACAGRDKDEDEAPQPPEGEDVQSAQGDDPNRRALRVDTSRCVLQGRRTEQVDLNHDGRMDLVNVFISDGSALSCQQADLNFDGRIDAYFHYGDKGQLVREQFDLDYDGRIDVGRHYENGALVLDEQDVNRDGYVDAWRRYDDGRLLRIETDRDADGRADMFTYYVAGRIDRIGYDVNGDGRVDQWDHDAARRARLAEQERLSKRAAQEPKVTTDEYVDAPDSDGEKVEPAETEVGASDAPEGKAGKPSRPQKPSAPSKAAKDPASPAKSAPSEPQAPKKPQKPAAPARAPSAQSPEG